MVTNNSCDYQPTQYNVQTGGASGTLNNVAPSATSGVPIISQGSSAQPIFGTAVVAGGGSGVTSSTAYALIAGGTTSTGPHQSLTTGTAGQLLQSGGSASLPTWVNNNASGNLVLIQSQVASASSSLTFTTGITSTYNNYLLIWSNYIPSTTQSLELQFSTNGGSSYLTSGYLGFLCVFASGSSTLATVTSSTFIYLNTNGNTTGGINGTAYLQSLTSATTSVYPAIQGTGAIGAGSTTNCEIFQGYNSTASATAVNAIKLLPSSGTITTGTFTLFGILE